MLSSETSRALPETTQVKVARREGQSSADPRVIPWLLKGLRLFQPFGVDYFCSRRAFLVANLVSRNLKLRYRRSALGFLWSLALPLAMAMVYFVVFQFVMRVQVDKYAVLIAVGVIPWSFFSTAVMEGMDSLVANHSLMNKIPIPIQVFPFSVATTNLVNLTFSLPVLFGIALFNGVTPKLSLLALPFFFASFFIIAYSLGLILSIAYVYFRDLRHIMVVGMQVWMYTTPILYPEHLIPAEYRNLIYFNPAATTFLGLRAGFLGEAWPRPEIFLTAAGWSLGLLLLSSWLVRRFRPMLVENF